MEQGSFGDSMYPTAFVRTAPLLDLHAMFVTVKQKLLHMFVTFTKLKNCDLNRIYELHLN